MNEFIRDVAGLFVDTFNAVFTLAYFWVYAGTILFSVALSVLSLIVRGSRRM